MPVVLLKNLAFIRKMDEFDPPLAAGHAMKGENNAALCLRGGSALLLQTSDMCESLPSLRRLTFSLRAGKSEW